MPSVLRRALDAIDDSYRHLGELSGMLERRYSGDAFRRVIYSDSHDSAANDGAARLSEEISPGNPGSLYSRRRSLLATAIVMTAPGVPMLLQGQEFLEGGSFTDWRALDWERAEKLSGIVEANKHLIALRRNLYGNSRGLIGQSFTITHLNEENKVMAYHRWDRGGPGDDVIVLMNLANKTYENYLINIPRDGTWKVRFNSDWKGYSPEFSGIGSKDVAAESGVAPVTIGPYSVLILSQD
jgi:1,4-alpha-glucan branching enzyme